MSSEIAPYEIRLMKADDIPQAVDIWKETGLAEGTRTIYTWFEIDPEGFYVAATEDGELYGTCAAVILNDDLAFLGLYAVRPKYQRKGIGVKIWKKAIEHIGDRNAGLNSVPEHLHTYRDLAGFKIVTDWQTVVCESVKCNTELLTQNVPGIEVQEIDDSNLPEVIRYDETVHGYSRSKIVSLTMSEQDSCAMAAIQQDGSQTVCGYGCLKQNMQGTAMVGPLYADNKDIAEVLLFRLISSFPHAQKHGLTLMIVDCNKDALSLVDKLGLQMSIYVPRCYLKAKVNVNFDKVYGQHALNFSSF